MKHDKQQNKNALSAKELYQIAKKNELLNQLRKERAEAAALDAFNLFADAMQQWTGNQTSNLLDDDAPLMETITLPEALRDPIPKNAFGMPIRSLLN